MVSVKGASAIASEPRYISPSPWPIASGEPLRAPIIRSPWQRSVHRVLRRCALEEVGIDQMSHGLGVGLAGEFRALLFEHLPQFAEILDDAVVNHRDVVGRMRMRVGL